MSSARMMMGAMLAVLAAPAIAQAQPEADTPRQRAVNAVEAPVTARLNNDVDAVTTARDNQRTTHAEAVAAGQQAQYAADMAAYHDKMATNRIIAAHDQAYYQRQQRAYADAMAAWRLQAHDCQKGSKAACNAPPPNPEDFR